ncbi:hypothetical protein AM493_18095 [Flavobacterium akiainvivens]|uniref:Lipoprotein n=1 Tax=Flavobacterium akiainvivens TaxID=1202724 RepID=A0A0M9VJH2_9FLAO|nr:hypothetical protein [Flavobacterium akiainvivens]KOS07746.1 hypothetical protein AM493_18095 [Flavobacterium akiainvivens]SFQ25501.1 hypothetical protein SAMN05444144_102200 [Flavobacterium akiainvivens]
MKKNLRKFLMFAMLPLFLVSCSADEDLTVAEPQNNHSVLRQSYWDGIIGVNHGNGNYEITANPQLLMSDLQEHLRLQGDVVTLQTIAIEYKKATNDNTDGYMLIASDNLGTSVGLVLALGANNTFKLDYGFSNGEDPYAISCRGCATGCNLQQLNMPGGGKFPYCASNGCGDFCQTRQDAF